MKQMLLIAALAALAGCKGPVKQAEDRYMMVSRHGAAAERCAEAQAVADAALQAGDEKAYAKWRDMAEGDCGSARLCKGSATGC
jgi:hypothetical protein